MDVTCPACGASSPEGSRFCGACGGSLEAHAPCPSCGAENPAGQRFCNQCGSALAPAASPAAEPPAKSSVAEPPAALARKLSAQAGRLAGERKQVTVLFADLVGSMELAERIDSERWQAIIERFFEVLAGAVHRFEGTVDKFTGDGIMALFGAPIAHEDHARRACYAALEMQRGVSEYSAELRRSDGISLGIRIGINSGDVIVGSIGDEGDIDYTAVGHTVGLAQRMESLAEPGKACLAESAARLAAGFLDLRDLGETEIKGASAPVRVFELAGVGSARGRLDVARQRGFSRFVGRSEEMAHLDAAFARAREGQGEVIGIVAEAGIGKSRLCHEFAERCRAHGADVYEVQCQPHGRSLPLMPVLEMLRAYFGIEPEDSDRHARERIAGRLLLLDPEFADDLGLMFDFLAVPDPERPPPELNPEARQRRLLGLVRRLVHARGRDSVVVGVLEDLHWIDPASEEFLRVLVEAAPGTRTLVVTNFRPEYHAEWMRHTYYRQLPLAPLGPEALDELLADLLGEDPSLDGLAELIRERTKGNPFFVEEAVREVAESGALAGDRGAYRLVRLIDRLTQEVAYGSQLGSARARTHARIAAGLEQDDPERLDERAALIAQHYEQAQMGMEAAAWHARAAGWAGFKDAEAALEHWARIRALDDLLPDSDEADAMRTAARLMLLSLGWRVGADLDESRRVFAECADLAERRGDVSTLSLAHTALSIAEGTCGGDVVEYVRIAERGAGIAERIEELNAGVAAATGMMYPFYLAGRFAESLSWLDRVLELTEDDPHLGAGITVGHPRAWATSFRAVPLIALGRLDEARAAIAEGIELCRRWDRESLGWTHTFYVSLARSGTSEFGPETLAHGRHGAEIADAIGSGFSRVVAYSWLGYALLRCGDPEQARRTLERCLQTIERGGVGLESEPGVRFFHARALAALGDVEGRGGRGRARARGAGWRSDR